MKLKKLDLIRLWNAIEACKEHKNTKFIYSTLRTKKLIEDEVEVLTAISAPSKKYKEFQMQRVESCKKFCEKENGTPVIKGGEYFFTEAGRKLFEAELVILKERFKDWIEERDEQMRSYDLTTKEEIDVEVHQVALCHVPEDLDASILSGLMPLIMEE